MLIAAARCGDDGVLQQDSVFNVMRSRKEGDDDRPVYRFTLCGSAGPSERLFATATVHDNPVPFICNVVEHGDDLDVDVLLNGATSSVSITVHATP